MKILTTKVIKSWNNFFFRQCSYRTLQLCGYVRIMFALLFLYDRILLTFDLNHFYGSTGIMSAAYAYQYDETLPPNFSLLTSTKYAIDNPEMVIWILHVIGIINGTFFLLGICKPRLHLLGIVANLISFQHYNKLIWDGQDVMFRIWSLLLLSMPLHHVKITEWANPVNKCINDRCDEQLRNTVKDEKETKEISERSRVETWPMWPMRLFQINVIFVYAGASIGKLINIEWRNGNALYYISHIDEKFGGFFNPSMIFDVNISLRLLTWISLFLELSSIILIWPKFTRKYTIVAMIFLHIGIEMSIILHCFEWLAIIGWLMFLAEPRDDTNEDELEEEGRRRDRLNNNSISRSQKKSNAMISSIRRLIENLFIISFILVYAVQTSPLERVVDEVPSIKSYVPQIQYVLDAQNVISDLVDPILVYTGLWQSMWSMYGYEGEEISQRFHAHVMYNDGTIGAASRSSDKEDYPLWTSPSFDRMNWIERKRYFRQILYYEYLPAKRETRKHFHALCQHIAYKHNIPNSSMENERNNNDRFEIAIILTRTYGLVPPSPEERGLGWFDNIKISNIPRDYSDEIYLLNLADKNNNKGLTMHNKDIICNNHYVDKGKCFHETDDSIKHTSSFLSDYCEEYCYDISDKNDINLAVVNATLYFVYENVKNRAIVQDIRNITMPSIVNDSHDVCNDTSYIITSSNESITSLANNTCTKEDVTIVTQHLVWWDDDDADEEEEVEEEWLNLDDIVEFYVLIPKHL